MKAVNLRTEYLENPVGIDLLHPRLMWTCEGGKKQTSYRITAVSDGITVWDSGRVVSDAMFADYPRELSSRQRVTWTVTLWDETGTEGEKSAAFFETGLLHDYDWQAEWIAGDYPVKRKERYPVDCFLKTFSVRRAARARLYVTACGLYEVRINGRKAGDALFTPGAFDYRKRVQYQTYDVTEFLAEGENVLTCELADGWYRGSSGSKGFTNTYGKRTKLLLQLEIITSDGEILRIVSDESWKWSQDGPIRFADLRDGERVDANRQPSYKGRARIVRMKKVPLTAKNALPVREMERFAPTELITTPKGKKVLKFPQNLSGYITFKLKARKGQRISVTLGEMLDEKGELTLKNIQNISRGRPTPLQHIEYVCKEGENVYTPKFFFGGFQYAEVEGDVAFEKENFEAVAVYSAFRETASFDCSHPLISQFFRNTMWSLKSNSTDIPTDCPTRERLGWTGDSQVFFNTASYLVDYAAFARKHVGDIFDRQWKSGRLPQIAPYGNEDKVIFFLNGSVGWACAGVYIPLYFYQKYGDDRLLREHFEGMMKYAAFMIRRAGKWGGPYARPTGISRKNRKYTVNAGLSYGEWAEPADVFAQQWYDFVTPHPEESTAYTYFTLKRVLEVARILGREDDPRLKKVKEYSEGARRAYQELVTKPKFTLDTDRQAKLVRPLYMGLLTKEQEAFARKRLIKAMEHYGWRLGTGFLSTPLILDVLADLDIEYAYKLLENEQMPGWLYMPKSGATTIWESWEGPTTPDKGIASLNHYSKGAVCEWLIGRMCGIRVEGRNHFHIEPLPGGSLTHARASYESIFGRVESGWERTEKGITYTVMIPCNCTADIVLPGGERHTVGAGNYTFTEEGRETVSE